MPSAGDAYLDIHFRTDKMVAEAQAGGKAAGDELAKGIAESAIAVEAASKAFDYMKEAIGSAVSEGKLMRQTEAVLKSTGEAAGITSKDIEELTNRLESKNSVDRESIRHTENLLLTYTALHNEVGKGNNVFDRATQVAIDMGAALGQDAASAATKLGRALQDPEHGLMMLTRTGVTFTAQQKEQIKTLVESGQAMEAQKLVLSALETKFAGSAAAQATEMDRAEISLHHMSVAIGDALLPAVEMGAKGLGEMAEVVAGLPAPINAGLMTLAAFGLGAVAVTKIMGVMSEVGSVLGPMLTRQAVATAELAVAEETQAVAAASALVEMDQYEVMLAAIAVTAPEAALGVEEFGTASVVAGEEVATAEAEVMAFNPILLGVGVAVAAVTAAVAIFGGRHKDTAEQVKALSSALIDQNGVLRDNDKLYEKWLEQSSQFKNGDQIDALNKMGMTLKSVGEELRGSSDEYDTFIRRVDEARQAGEINVLEEKRLSDSYKTSREELEKQAEQYVKNIRNSESLSKATIDLAEANHHTAQGGVDWLSVQKDLSAQLKIVDAAEKDAATSADALGASWNYAGGYGYGLASAAAMAKDSISDSYRTMFGAADATDSFNKSIEGLTKTVGGGGGAASSAESNALKVEKADKNLADAEASLADAIQRRYLIQQGPDANKLAIAQIEARQKMRDLTNATDAAADAEKALQEAQKSNTGPAIAHATQLAEMEVALADREVVRATLAVTDAHTKLDKARASGVAEDVTKAELDLADAEDGVIHKTDAAKLAHDHLKTAQDLGKEAAKQAARAADQVSAAHDGVTLASIASEDAQKNLTATQNSGKEGSPELVAATKTVADAQLKVNEALLAVTEAQKGTTSGSGPLQDAFMTTEDKTRKAAKAGADYIQSLIDQKAPASEIHEALGKIHGVLQKITDGNPAAAQSGEEYFQRIQAAADLASWPIERMAKAMAGLALGYTGQMPDVLKKLNSDLAAGGVPQAHAGGGFPHAGWGLVGEHGPEVVDWGGSERVLSSETLAAALAGNGRPDGLGDTVHVHIGSVVGDRRGAEMVSNVVTTGVSRVFARKRAGFDLHSGGR